MKKKLIFCFSVFIWNEKKDLYYCINQAASIFKVFTYSDISYPVFTRVYIQTPIIELCESTLCDFIKEKYFQNDDRMNRRTF